MNWSEYYLEFCSGAFSSVGHYVLLPLKVFFHFIGKPILQLTAYCVFSVLQAIVCWATLFIEGVVTTWYYFKIIYPTLDFWIIEPTLERVFLVLNAYIEAVIKVFITEPSDFIIYKIVKPVHLHLSNSKYTKDRWEYLDDLKDFINKAIFASWYVYKLSVVPFTIGYKNFQDMFQFCLQIAAYFLGPLMKILTTCITPDDITFSWYYRFKYMLRTSRNIFTKVKYVAFYPIHTPPGTYVEENKLTNDLYRLGTLPLVIFVFILYIPIEMWFDEYMNRAGMGSEPFVYVDLMDPQPLDLLFEYPGTLFSNWDYIQEGFDLVVFDANPLNYLFPLWPKRLFDWGLPETLFSNWVFYEIGDEVSNLWHYTLPSEEKDFSLMEAIFFEIAWWISW